MHLLNRNTYCNPLSKILRDKFMLRTACAYNLRAYLLPYTCSCWDMRHFASKTLPSGNKSKYWQEEHAHSLISLGAMLWWTNIWMSGEMPSKLSKLPNEAHTVHKCINLSCKLAKSFTMHEQERQKSIHGDNTTSAPTYLPRSLEWLLVHATAFGISSKLLPKYESPYRVVESTCVVKLPDRTHRAIFRVTCRPRWLQITSQNSNTGFR